MPPGLSGAVGHMCIPVDSCVGSAYDSYMEPVKHETRKTHY